MLLLVGVALVFAARASAAEAKRDDAAAPDEQAVLVAEGKALFDSVDAFGQQPSQGPTVAGLRVSCSTCHPGPAFTDGRNHVVAQTGAGKTAPRQTPHLLQLKDTGPFSWDGRNTALQQQIRGAVTSPLEMNAAREPTARQLDALAAFVETLDVPDATPGVDFDPVLAERGRILFDQARGTDPGQEFNVPLTVACGSCHIGPKRTDGGFHKILMPFGDPVLDPGRVEPDGRVRGFKTPVLRGLRFTAPYFHEGLGGDPTAMRTPVNSPPRPALLETVAFYNERFVMGFTPEEMQALTEYLLSL
ncbi:MAG TPA: cytochrome c peroxidase [Acidimicrobiales bacterium]|nr:cytochrome c peroxidase [Acidimicrobiales bacterium]